MSAEVTDKQLHILRHALGLTRGLSYRNYFVTGEGSKDWDDCLALCDAGLMVRPRASSWFGPDAILCVTEAGAKIAGREDNQHT